MSRFADVPWIGELIIALFAQELLQPVHQAHGELSVYLVLLVANCDPFEDVVHELAFAIVECTFALISFSISVPHGSVWAFRVSSSRRAIVASVVH